MVLLLKAMGNAVCMNHPELPVKACGAVYVLPLLGRGGGLLLETGLEILAVTEKTGPQMSGKQSE